jgi:nucleotide-binding universal stress UspA family protein
LKPRVAPDRAVTESIAVVAIYSLCVAMHLLRLTQNSLDEQESANLSRKSMEAGFMTTILVPLDGSTVAEQILPYARTLARLMNAQLHLLDIVPEPAHELVGSGLTVLYGTGDALDREQSRQRGELEEAFARAETYIDTQTSRLEDANLVVQSNILGGQPASVIVELACESHTKLVAMATHGRGGLQRWALGSVADRVAQASAVSVLLVRAAPHLPPADFSLKHILVPLDGSELARQALPLACELAQAAHAKITLIQAVSPKIEGYPSLLTQPLPSYGVILNVLRVAAQQELEQIAGQIHQPGVPIEIAVVTGHAAEVIVDEAAKRAASMIVMATHGYGGLRRWALGSVADQVLHATNLPLMLVRAH